MGFHVPGGRRDPGSQGYAVNEGDTAEGDSFEEMGAQGYGAADVVSRYGGSIEVEGLYQLGEEPRLA